MCVLLKKKHEILSENLRKFFREETQCSEPTGIKFDENAVFSAQFLRFFKENCTCCDWQIFFFISERFEDFS